MEYKILTSGRLGEEFAEYCNQIPNMSCTIIEDAEEIERRISEFNVLAGLNFYAHADISHIKWIHAFSAGVESTLHHPHFNKNIILTRTVGRMGRKMGEYCLSYVLYILKNIERLRNKQSQKEWVKLSFENLMDKKILIFGTGGIGTGVAEIFRPLSQQVIGVNTSGLKSPGFDQVLKIEEVKNLDGIGLIINSLPLTSHTTAFFNLSFFENFRNCIFINVGRGGSVVQEDLLQALNRNFLSKAVLDVFEQEPLPKNSPLYSNTDVIITPHQSALTDIEDVKISFNKAYDAIRKGSRNELFVDLSKSY